MKASTVTAAVLASSIAGAAPAAAQSANSRAVAELRESRYQIGVMERVLEGAVEHGVTRTRDRYQAVVPAEMQFMSENARVRGFRLDGYGVFFDVIVPSFQGTLPWVLRTLDQNDLGLENALKALRAHVDASRDANLEQALHRVELQVGPVPVRAQDQNGTPNADPSGVAAARQAAAADPQIVSDPNEAFRGEVKQALMDVMLDHSSSLGIDANEWLTVAARRNADRPQLAPADSDAGTMVIRVRGSDLAAFLARQISREDALKRIEVRVF